MKKIMGFVITVLISISIFQTSFSQTITISCDQDAAKLSSLFAANWQPNFSGPYRYISIAKDLMGNKEFSGTLHAMTSDEPADKNPHLRFSSINLKDIPHYGLWQIDCRYSIGNSQMQDQENFLHMVAGVDDYNYQCAVQPDQKTVVCHVNIEL